MFAQLQKISLVSTHLLEAVGDALDEGVAAAAISDALLVRREIFAHGSGVVVVEGFGLWQLTLL